MLRTAGTEPYLTSRSSTSSSISGSSEVSGDHRRVLTHSLDCPGRKGAPVVEHVNITADGKHHVDIMFNQQNATAKALRQLPDQAREALALSLGHAGGWFVKQQE